MIIPTADRYFYFSDTEIPLTTPQLIPANQFTNDAGEPTNDFGELGQNSITHLFINGILQRGSYFELNSAALILAPQGGTIYADTSIILETVQ